jgi:hypothetical protein
MLKQNEVPTHARFWREWNRVLLRIGARALTQEEIDQVGVGGGPPCRMTFTHLPKGGSDEDVQCP